MSIWKRFVKAMKNITLICFGVLSCHKEVEVIIRVESPDNSIQDLNEMTPDMLEKTMELLAGKLIEAKERESA